MNHRLPSFSEMNHPERAEFYAQELDRRLKEILDPKDDSVLILHDGTRVVGIIGGKDDAGAIIEKAIPLAEPSGWRDFGDAQEGA